MPGVALGLVPSGECFEIPRFVLSGESEGFAAFFERVCVKTGEDCERVGA